MCRPAASLFLETLARRPSAEGRAAADDLEAAAVNRAEEVSRAEYLP